MKSESELKGELSDGFAKLRDWKFIKHEDVRTATLPDATLTGAGATGWWEFKVRYAGEMEPRHRKGQLKTARELDALGTYARLLVWDETPRRTMVMKPEPSGRWAIEREWAGHEADRAIAEIIAIHLENIFR